MFDTIAGLPLHPLVVHAVEVVVPAAALVLLVAAVWPRFRRWAYALPLLLALASLVLVPVATQSGEALLARVGATPAIATHMALGEQLLPWVAALVVVAAAMFWLEWRERHPAPAADGPGTTLAADRTGRTGRSATRGLTLLLVVAALVVSTGTTVQAIRIGHSGATAVWGQVGSITPTE